jgi:hypothetical protein
MRCEFKLACRDATEHVIAMRLKNLLLTVLIALSTLSVPTALMVAPTVLTGCTSTGQKKAVNTLFSLGQTVDTSYQSYMDLVVAEKVSTNSLPIVAQAYLQFQNAFNLATVMVGSNTNATTIPADVLNAAAGVNAAIAKAKKGN